MKKKTSTCQVGAAKSKRKAIKHGNTPRALNKKRKGHSKISASLSNNAIYEQKCLEIIKKVYKQAGKWDDQKQFKNMQKIW